MSFSPAQEKAIIESLTAIADRLEGIRVALVASQYAEKVSRPTPKFTEPHPLQVTVKTTPRDIIKREQEQDYEAQHINEPDYNS